MIEEIREVLRRYDQALITEEEAKVKMGMIIVQHGEEIGRLVRESKTGGTD